ncbi:MAG: hypothetical protein ACO35E_05815, partial [Ilumatobacteraceae bacterium]
MSGIPVSAGALAMGLAAALLVSWATAARARVALSRRARSQVGLAEIPDHTVTALIGVSSGSAA